MDVKQQFYLPLANALPATIVYERIWMRYQHRTQ